MRLEEARRVVARGPTWLAPLAAEFEKRLIAALDQSGDATAVAFDWLRTALEARYGQYGRPWIRERRIEEATEAIEELGMRAAKKWVREQSALRVGAGQAQGVGQ